MKKTTKPLAAVTAALLLAITANAETVKDYFCSVLEKYSENNPAYKAAELQYEKSRYSGYSNQYNLKSIESSIEDNERELKSLEYQLSEESDCYEKESLCANIEYRKIYAFELEFNKAELELEAAFQAITEEYSEVNLNLEKKRLEYELRSKLNSLTALKKQLAYLEFQEKYCTENVDIIKSSLKIGYATQLDVENAKAQLSAASAQVAECKMQIEQLKNDILLNSGEEIQEYSHNYLCKCDISKNELLEQFNEASPQDEMLEKQAQAYRDTVDKIDDINKRLGEYVPKENESNTEYQKRLYERVGGALAYYKNELATAENNMKSYEINLKLYVSELLGKKDVCAAQIAAAEAALKAAETNMDVMNAFYAEGRVRPIDMTEAYVKRAKAEYDLTAARASLDNIIFTVENSIIIN